MGNQQGVVPNLEDRIYACLIEQPLEPGEVRLVVSRDRPQAIGVGPIGDFAGSWLAPNPEIGAPVLVNEEMGFTETVGEMPARLIVRDRSLVPGADQLRTWIVAMPQSADMLWWIQAVMRGPDLPALEAEVDGIVRSLRFDELPAPLDEAGRDAAVAIAIDSVDKEMRQYPGRRFLSCIPRKPGSVAATIEDGPRGLLIAPLDVTCTTTVTTNDLRVWQADIEVAWPATGGHEAGRWARQLLFDATGAIQGWTDVAPGTGEAMDFPGDPSVTDVPTEVATFAPGDLVRSIGAGSGASFYDVDTTLLPPEPWLSIGPGGLAVIVSGPEVFDGRDFYVADGGMELGWVGAEAKGAPVLAHAEPVCPTPADATELVYVSALERRLCATGEVTLGPVQAGPQGRHGSVLGGDRQRSGVAGRGTAVGTIRRRRRQPGPGVAGRARAGARQPPDRGLAPRPRPFRRSCRGDLPDRLPRGLGPPTAAARGPDAPLPGAVRRDQLRADGGAVMLIVARRTRGPNGGGNARGLGGRSDGDAAVGRHGGHARALAPRSTRGPDPSRPWLPRQVCGPSRRGMATTGSILPS